MSIKIIFQKLSTIQPNWNLNVYKLEKQTLMSSLFSLSFNQIYGNETIFDLKLKNNGDDTTNDRIQQKNSIEGLAFNLKSLSN